MHIQQFCMEWLSQSSKLGLLGIHVASTNSIRSEAQSAHYQASYYFVLVKASYSSEQRNNCSYHYFHLHDKISLHHYLPLSIKLVYGNFPVSTPPSVTNQNYSWVNLAITDMKPKLPLAIIGSNVLHVIKYVKILVCYRIIQTMRLWSHNISLRWPATVRLDT